jgi:hypothetical protein
LTNEIILIIIYNERREKMKNNMDNPLVRVLTDTARTLVETQPRRRRCGHEFSWDVCSGCIDHIDCWWAAERRQAVVDAINRITGVVDPERTENRRRDTLTVALLRRGETYWFDAGAGPAEYLQCQLIDLCEGAWDTSEPMVTVLFQGKNEPEAVEAGRLRRMDDVD